MSAMCAGKWDVVKFLVEHGADVNERDKKGKTALMKAGWCNRFDIIEYLRENGAFIEEQLDINGTNRTEVVKFFQERLDKDGDTALMKAAKARKWEDVKKLIESGACVDERDFQGKTVLMYAAERGDLDIVKYLIEKGAYVRAKDRAGMIAQAYAENAGKTDVARYLCGFS